MPGGDSPTLKSQRVNITILEGTIEEVVAISCQVPEFKDPYPAEEYHLRLKEKEHLVLVAKYEDEPAGFKVGYNKENDGSFYSWMGAVLPKFRKLGIAQALLEEQVQWARSKGYKSVRFKTRNHLKPMLIFGLKNGFDIIEVIPYPGVKDHRILLEKSLK